MNLLNSFFGEPVPTLSVLDLHEKMKDEKRPFLLDVRQPAEFR